MICPTFGSSRAIFLGVFPIVLATVVPMCTPRVEPTAMPWDAPLASFWARPDDLSSRDLLYGPWGADHAPDPHAEYTYVRPKTHGVNPGLVVTDPQGREWHVKQAPHGRNGDEGPAEVVLSRVLSAVGYHQPPVYYLPAFTMRDHTGAHTEPGGRFRLHDSSMKAVGEWEWQQNPFVGMRPYQGLLVILLLFNSSDLKNSNNTLYEVVRNDQHAHAQWYVVRDLGTALGETGRVDPTRNNPDIFHRTKFITGISHGFAVFDYHGFHQELIRDRIIPDDVGWAGFMLGQLTVTQWQDAFRAGGYDRASAARFIEMLRARVALAQQVGGDDWAGSD